MKTISVSATNPLIRLYAWTWGASLDRINFCKIFWGLLFIIPGFLIIKPIISAYLWQENKWVERHLTPGLPKPPKSKNERMQAILGKIEEKGSKYGLWVIGGIVSLGLLVLAVALVIALINDFWVTLLWIGVFIGIMALSFGFIFAAEQGVFRKPGRVFVASLQILYHAVKSFKTKTCPIVEIES